MECIIKKKEGGKPFKYVDFLRFGNHDVAPSTSSEFDEREVKFDIEIDGSPKNGRVYLVLTEILTHAQFCGMDDEEIEVDGDEIYDYIEPHIGFTDIGQYYVYCSKADAEPLDLADYQVDLIDDVCGAANALLTTLNPKYEWDMAEIGELADLAVELLHKKEMSAIYPSIVTLENGVQYTTDEIKPEPAKQPLSDKSAGEIADAMLETLDPKVQDALYRKIWKSYTVEDVEAQLEENPRVTDDTDIESIADIVADRFVYGEYDCNMSYWDNLNSLISEELRG